MKKTLFWILGFTLVIVAGLIILKTAVSGQTAWLSDEQKRSLATTVTAFADPWYQFISLADEDKLPTYQLTITGSDINQLLSSIPKRKLQILTNAAKKTVPAQLIYQSEEKLPVKISLHGEFWPHWWNRKKSFSLRLDQGVLKNNAKFSFILPEERGYIDEVAGIILAQKLGLIAPQFEYAHLRLNHSNQGVYFVTEEFTPEFLRRINPNDPITIYAENEVNLDQPINLSPNQGKWKILATTQSTETLTPIDELKRIYALPDDQEFFTQAEKLFDIDQVLKWQALSLMLGDHHQDDYHNNRLLYNHTTQKLSFIPEDVYIFSTQRNLSKVYPHNSLVKRLLNNPNWLTKRNQILQISLDSEYLPQLATELTSTYQQFRKAFFHDTNKAVSNYHFSGAITSKLATLQENHRYLEQQLNLYGNNFDLNANEVH